MELRVRALQGLQGLPHGEPFMVQESRRSALTSRRARRRFVNTDSELPQLSDRPVAPKTIQRRRAALGVLLVLSFIAVARLAEPVWVGIVFGALMAFTTQPLYRRLSIAMHERRRWAALVTTLVTGIGCVVAGALSLYVLTRELFGVMAVVQKRLDSGSLTGIIGGRGVAMVERFGVNQDQMMRRIQDEVARATSYITEAAGFVVETTTTAVLGLVIGCITMYYVLIEWPSIPVRLERVLPLDPRHTRALVLEFRDVGRSALIGTMVTAMVQALLATLGYMISDLPHAITWGLLTGVASFFPVVGTALVWLPVSLSYASNGQVGFALFQALWGLFLVVGIGDYTVRPRLVGRQGKGQPLLMLVAALGGIQVFGLAGIVVGPVLMSLFLAILKIYEREMESSERSDTQPLFPMKPTPTPTETRVRERADR